MDNNRKMMPMSEIMKMTTQMNPDDFEVGSGPLDVTPLIERDGDNFSPDDDNILLRRPVRTARLRQNRDPEAEG